MLGIEEWFMIRELHAQVFSLTDISDKTGYDWKIIQNYLNSTTISETKTTGKKRK
ncbi:MAG: hypothetical protein WA130_07410 [Candidatus Methanoperedens sp.]